MIYLWQFCFSVSSEYVHNYNVSSMAHFRNLVFCTWLVRIFFLYLIVICIIRRCQFITVV